MSILLTVDLSTPNDMWLTFEALHSYLTNRIETSLTEAARKDNSLWDKVTARVKERLGGDHMVSKCCSTHLKGYIML